MGIKAGLLLGMFLLFAALLHGGIYSTGHDFVVNRFTGTFQFVPAEDEEDEATLPATCTRHTTLTFRRPGVRVPGRGLHGAWREISTGR